MDTESVFLKQRNKLVGEQHAPVLGLPAHQRFSAGQQAGAEINFRL